LPVSYKGVPKVKAAFEVENDRKCTDMYWDRERFMDAMLVT
jgi:hypothetical protein